MAYEAGPQKPASTVTDLIRWSGARAWLLKLIYQVTPGCFQTCKPAQRHSGAQMAILHTKFLNETPRPAGEHFSAF